MSEDNGERAERIHKRLGEIAEMAMLELGLDCIQILAVACDDVGKENETYIDHEAGHGMLHARINLARNFVMRKDTYIKREAWDSAYGDSEE